MKGYYEQSMREYLAGMQKVQPLEETAQVASEEEAEELEVGTVFLAPNGQWYIVAGERTYRRWYWGTPRRAA